MLWDLEFDPEGDRLAIIDDQSQAVVLLDAASDNESQRLKLDASAGPMRIAISPSGRQLAVTDGRGEVTIFDIASGARVHGFLPRLPQSHSS